jgi:hypothetical protein
VATPALVQVRPVVLGAGNQTFTDSFSALPAIGNYVVVAQTSGGSVTTGDTCTDNQGHTYTKQVTQTGISLWTTKVATSASTFTVTLFGNNSSANAGLLMEVTGVDGTTPIDGTPGTATQAGFTFKSLTCPAGTSTQTNDLLILLHQTGQTGNVPSYGGAMSVVASNTAGGSDSSLSVGKGVVNSIAAQSGSVSWAVATNYDAVALLLKGSAGPVISAPPQSQVVNAGGFANFSVSATGTGSLHYQWQVNGSNVGTDSAMLVYQPARSERLSIVTVTVTDDVGSTISQAANLQVLRAAAQKTRRRQTQSYDNGGTDWFHAELLAAGAFNFDPSLFVLPSGGGTTYNVSVGEAATAADAPSAIMVASLTLAEAAATADAIVGALVAALAAAESSGVADAPSAVSVTAAVAAESLGAVDAPAATGSLPVAAAESTAISDAVAAVGALVGALGESSAAADAPSAVMTTAAVVSEATTAADAPSTSSAISADVAESSAGADAPSAVLATPQSIAESIAAADASGAALAASESVAESSGTSDGPFAALSTPQAVDEASSASDSSVAASANDQAVAESAAATDSASSSAILEAAAADSAAIAEAVGGIAILGISLAEALAASDLVNQGSGTLVGVSEVAATADAAAAVQMIGALILDALAATDATGASAVIVAQALETMSPDDVLDATRILALALAELAQASDAPSASGTAFDLGIGESLSAIDAAAWLAIAYSLLRVFLFPAYSRVFMFPAYPRAFAFPASSRFFNFTTGSA